MKRMLFSVIFLIIALPAFAQGPEGFVGTWKSDPGTPMMTRKLTLEGKIIVMTELQPGRNGGPDLTILRKYPTDGSEVSMDTGMWAGAKATGKMEGNVLTVDTTMANGAKFHDVWTLSADGKHYSNDMVITGMRGGRAAGQGGGQANDAGKSASDAQGSSSQANGGSQNSGNSAPRTVKFSFTKED